MQEFTMRSIGKIHTTDEGAFLEINKEYLAGINGLKGFSHLTLIWVFSDFMDEMYRDVIEGPQPYKNAPETMGVFATRSPVRPNPIALSTVEVTHIDEKAGRIYITYTDAHNGTPILDIKPYTPSIDRVENPRVPEWCEHWPKSYETSGAFDWESEFLF